MEQGSVFQFNGFVSFAFLIDQKRKVDAGFLAKESGIGHVAEADSGEAHVFTAEFFFMCAQLRDVFSAEDSTIVAQEDHGSRRIGPERTQADDAAVNIWERDSGQPAAERVSHAGILSDEKDGVKGDASDRRIAKIARNRESEKIMPLMTRMTLIEIKAEASAILAALMRDIRNAVAVITGAGSGIGRALAQDLAKRGARLALADVNSEALNETRQLLGTTEARTYTVDVGKAAEVEQFALKVQQDFGGVRLLINNAGVALFGTFAEVSLEDMEWLIRINFWGVVYGCKFFLPMLQRERDAHIVNVSSIFGLVGPPGQTAYSSSKFAVRGFSESLREELRATSSIKVTSVHPAGIATPIAEKARSGQRTDPAMRERAKALFKKVAIIKPEEAARVIVKGILGDKKRVMIGADAYRVDWIARLFPDRASAMYADALTRRAEREGPAALPSKSASK